jgi:hypothetical protein
MPRFNETGHRERRRFGGGLLIVLGVLVAAALASSAGASALPGFTWNGGGAIGAGNWSNAANWTGGVAPSAFAGALTFPALTDAACTAAPRTATCYDTANDLSGLSAYSISIDDGHPYNLNGTGITLGLGGMTAAPDPSDAGGGPQIGIPITLSANQTWTITGGSLGQQVNIGGTVTGQADTLGLSFSGGTFLGLGGDTEVGAISATGAGVLVDGASVNGTDGNPVGLSGGAALFIPSKGATSGPITMSGGEIQVGQGAKPDGTLAVNGGFTLDSSSSMTFFVNGKGKTPGTAFSQLTATGDISLGNASLRIVAGSFGNQSFCGKLHTGDVLPLLKTSGSVTGEFAGLPNNATLKFGCHKGQVKVRINYTAKSVTVKLLAHPRTLGHPPSGRFGATTTVSAYRVAPSGKSFYVR